MHGVYKRCGRMLATGGVQACQQQSTGPTHLFKLQLLLSLLFYVSKDASWSCLSHLVFEMLYLGGDFIFGQGPRLGDDGAVNDGVDRTRGVPRGGGDARIGFHGLFLDLRDRQVYLDQVNELFEVLVRPVADPACPNIADPLQ